jgi:hypothetical protein
MPRRSRADTICKHCGQKGHYATECSVNVECNSQCEDRPVVNKQLIESIAKSNASQLRKRRDKDEVSYKPGEMLERYRQHLIRQTEQLELCNKFNDLYGVGDVLKLANGSGKSVTLRTVAIERYGTAVVWVKNRQECLELHEVKW